MRPTPRPNIPKPTTLGTTAAVALLTLVAATACTAPGEAADRPGPPGADQDAVPQIEWGLVMHGGAGTMTRESMTPDQEQEYRETMAAAMRAGHDVLRDGGGSLDAVVSAINVLEDSPLFNSGRGAVFTAEGTNSLDASIMHGPTLDAGAVAGVMHVKNPITLARHVMEESPHVLLAGEGAEVFAELQGVEMVDPSYFHTERRWESLQRAKEAEARQSERSEQRQGRSSAGSANAEKFGTVGVIALDRNGEISAGTSTGGMTNKKWDRIGDSPIIGAGTYADANCGISSTGWGEYFIRNVVAYDICARAKYLDIPLNESARRMIMEQLEEQEPATGGIVGLDGDGNVVMMFNSEGMYRGYVGADGEIHTAIYRD